MEEHQIPEKASRSQLRVGGQGHRTELDREQDVWYAVAELAKGKSYREIAKDLSEKKHYNISFQQIYAALMKRGYTAEEIDEMYSERGGYAGDPRYLETLLHIQRQRMDLLGIGKGNDVAQNTIVQYNFGDASVDELARISDALQEGKQKSMVDEQ